MQVIYSCAIYFPLLGYLHRELEARLGATPPPSPSDRNSPAFLNSRIMQLSSEVARLKRMLNQTDAQSEYSLCVCVSGGVGFDQICFIFYPFCFSSRAMLLMSDGCRKFDTMTI